MPVNGSHLDQDETSQFAHNYLSPHCDWKAGKVLSEMFDRILEAFQYVNQNQISTILRTMPYPDFLNTPYWKAIAAKVKQEAGNTCQQCWSPALPLHVHHKTYEHHGEEILYWKEDLICLCERCHAQFHGIR